jgi:hypothetical protein
MTSSLFLTVTRRSKKKADEVPGRAVSNHVKKKINIMMIQKKAQQMFAENSKFFSPSEASAASAIDVKIVQLTKAIVRNG